MTWADRSAERAEHTREALIERAVEEATRRARENVALSEERLELFRDIGLSDGAIVIQLAREALEVAHQGLIKEERQQ